LPRIAEFSGIVIAMFYNDHEPPHFHAITRESRAVIAIEPARLLAGDLPLRLRGRVMEWTTAHRSDLIQNWARARRHEPLRPIEPGD
jgi:hypothetical protein